MDVRMPDGTLVTGVPDDITQSELLRRYELSKQPQLTPETTIGGHAKEFAKGLGSGAINLLETAGTGFAAMLPEEVEKQGRKAMEESLSGAKEYLKAERGYEDTMSRKLGEGLGSTLPFFAAAPLGVPGMLAGVATGVAAGAGESRQRAEAEGATGSERAWATALGIAPGLLDVVAPELKVGKTIITRALMKGGVEGATEAAQRIAQNLIAKGVYSPDSPIFEGAGEEGAYGAGVGAIASTLVDLALGKRARGIKAPKEEKPTEEKPAGIAALPHYANPPMVTFPDGTTSSDPAVIEAYRQQKYEQDRYMPGETPAGPLAQGELFPEGLPTRPGERAGYVPSITPTAEEAAPQPVAAPEGQGQLDLSSGQTLDQQIEEMYRQDEVNKAKSDLDTAQSELDTLLKQLDSDIAETDARVATSEVKKVELPRLQALREIIAAPEVTNIPKVFGKYLSLQGYKKNTPFTDRERAVIDKAIDVKLATPEVDEVTPGTDVAADTAAMEALVPEKGAKPTAPGQMSFPGMGKPKGEVVAEAEPEIVTTETINKDLFDRLGVSPKTPIRSRLEGVSLTDPMQRTQARADLLEFSLNPNIKAPVRNAVKSFINSDIFRTQGEMFTKAGELRKASLPPTAQQVEQRKAESAARREAEKQRRSEIAKKGVETRKAKKEAESAVTRTEPTTTGVSTEGTVGERGERRPADIRAARTEPSKTAGLGDTQRVSGQPAGRKGTPQPALSEETKAKVELNEWEQTTNKLLQTSSGPTLAEILAAKKAKKLEGALALSPDLEAHVLDMVKKGDVAGALNAVADSVGGVAGRIAKQLAKVVGDVKIEVVDDLGSAGEFDPKTNTIKLDAKQGINAHTFLHESVHAATSHVLDNKNHPVTKQLQKLFDDVKGSLDTAYGATSLDEFVAEAFSNPEFQAKLSALNVNGEAVTAWQRFTNTIKNFLRRMVGMEPTSATAMGEADKLISAIMSPSPETRDAGSLYMVSSLGKGVEWMDNLIKSRSILPEGPNVDAYHEFFTGTVTKAAKKALAAALPLHAFADVARSRIPMAEAFKRIVEKHSSEDHKNAEALTQNIKDVNRWYRKQPADVRAAFDVIGPDSSRMQVDPSKDRSKYAGKKDEDGNDLGKAWDSLQADWKKIGPEGQKLYEMQRDIYRAQYDKLQKLLGARIDETIEDKDTATQLKNEIYNRLAKRGGIEPYFPLHREGDYWVQFTGKDPRMGNVEPVVRAFTSKRARDRFIEELKAEGVTDIKEYGNFRASNFKDLPPTSFASNVVKTLENAKVDTETIDQVMRLYIDLLPESSFAQAFRTRKGTLGYEGSAVDTFRKKVLSTERQMTNMKYGAEYAKLIRETEEHIRASGSDPASILLGDELTARIKLAAKPQVPKWAKVATSLNFNMFMGLNISSALVNLSQVPLVVAPYLGGKYGMSETTAALGRATKIVMNSGKDRQIDDYLSTPDKPVKRTIKSYLSIDNYDYSKKPELKHLETLTRIADERGQLNHSQMQDALDMDSTDTLLGRVNSVTGFVFHHGERLNRQVAMVAAYELELQKLVGEGKPLSSATKEQMEAAANEAIYVTEMTNGDTAAAAAPRLAQGASGIGKVMFLFKRYGASMYYMLAKTAHTALRKKPDGMSAEEWKLTKREAMKQLAGVYGSAALLAGVKGMPLFGMAALIFNMFRDDDEDDFETAARKWMGEVAYKGPVNALTGLDISGRVGLSDLIFRGQAYSKDMTPMQSIVEVMGGPLFSIGNKFFRGVELIGQGEMERGIEQIVPTAVGSLMKATRFATEGTTTLRGDPITGEVSPWNVGAQAFGFAPADYIQQLEINANEKRIDRSSNEKRSNLLRQYYKALREGDADGMSEIADEMREFSMRHPGLAITGKTIKDSMAQHAKTSATMFHGITISKGMRSELMRNASEYDNGLSLFD